MTARDVWLQAIGAGLAFGLLTASLALLFALLTSAASPGVIFCGAGSAGLLCGLPAWVALVGARPGPQRARGASVGAWVGLAFYPVACALLLLQDASQGGLDDGLVVARLWVGLTFFMVLTTGWICVPFATLLGWLLGRWLPSLAEVRVPPPRPSP